LKGGLHARTTVNIVMTSIDAQRKREEITGNLP